MHSVADPLTLTRDTSITPDARFILILEVAEAEAGREFTRASMMKAAAAGNGMGPNRFSRAWLVLQRAGYVPGELVEPPPARTASPVRRLYKAEAAVYRLFNIDGVLLYVGVTRNVEQRWRQHERDKPWWPQVAYKTVEWFATRAQAETEEARAIREEDPLRNIDGHDKLGGAR